MRASRTCEGVMTGFRPTRSPRTFFAASRAAVRSATKALSYCAKDPNTPNSIVSTAVVVSMLSRKRDQVHATVAQLLHYA